MGAIKENKEEGFSIITMHAGDYEAKILPQVGGNLIALNYKEYKLLRTYDHLVDIEKDPCIYGTPVLIPPSRIRGGRFTYCNQEYNFPINEPDRNNSLHGFLQDKPFTVKSLVQEQDYALLTLFHKVTVKSEVYKYIPHEFTCELCFKLTDEGMEQTIKVHNHSDKVMPYGLAYHTAFNLNFNNLHHEEELLLKASVKQHVELTKEMVPSGHFGELGNTHKQMRGEGMPVLTEDLDNIFTVESLESPRSNFHGMVLLDPTTHDSIVYEVGSSFAYWVIWNCGKEGSFLCVEPQTWLTNGVNMDLPEKITNVIGIAPGEKYVETSRLYYHKMV